MSVKLDKKDYKILYELSRNCRIPFSKLAKAVGLSREVTQYRFKRLIKERVIVDFIAEIDERKLGFGRHLIYLAFQHVDEHKEKKIIQFIVSHPFVSWTTTSTGKWSVIFDFIARDLTHVDTFIDEIKNLYGEFIGEYVIASQISFKHFYSKYYLVEEEAEREKKALPHRTDKTDLKLLQLISCNPRLDYVSLSKQLELSPNAVKGRMNTLIQAKVLTHFCIYPNKVLLGYTQYYLQLDFINQTRVQEKQIIEYIIQHPSMNAYYRPLGHWSIEIAVFVKHPGELRRIILDLRNKYGSIMKVHDTMLVYEEPKSNYLPPGVFDVSDKEK